MLGDANVMGVAGRRAVAAPPPTLPLVAFLLGGCSLVSDSLIAADAFRFRRLGGVVLFGFVPSLVNDETWAQDGAYGIRSLGGNAR